MKAIEAIADAKTRARASGLKPDDPAYWPYVVGSLHAHMDNMEVEHEREIKRLMSNYLADIQCLDPDPKSRFLDDTLRNPGDMEAAITGADAWDEINAFLSRLAVNKFNNDEEIVSCALSLREELRHLGMMHCRSISREQRKNEKQNGRV